jgi:hypothetical protein
VGDVISFLYALFNHWIALMSGAVSLVLTLILRVRRKDISDKPFWVLTALCFLFAFYLTWQDERAKERLTCKIDKVVVDQWPDEEATQVFVLLSVRNTGTPTIAENYKLHIKASDLEYSAPPTKIPTNYPLSPTDKGSIATFDEQGSLMEKTRKPIATGDMVRGWLRFVIRLPEAKPAFIRHPGVTYTVTLTDVSGNACSAEYVTQGDGQ